MSGCLELQTVASNYIPERNSNLMWVMLLMFWLQNRPFISWLLLQSCTWGCMSGARRWMQENAIKILVKVKATIHQVEDSSTWIGIKSIRTSWRKKENMNMVFFFFGDQIKSNHTMYSQLLEKRKKMISLKSLVHMKQTRSPCVIGPSRACLVGLDHSHVWQCQSLSFNPRREFKFVSKYLILYCEIRKAMLIFHTLEK